MPAAALATYLTLAAVAYWHAWTGGPAARMQGPGGDDASYIWWLRWMAYAIVHGHNPFHSSWLNYPTGVNLEANASVALLGLVATPLTLTLGAAASLNVLHALGFAASAFAGYVLRRRWTARPAAALI